MLKVLKSGFFTSIQDTGRFGYREMGVPVSGAMDDAAVRKANMLLDNNLKAAVLEITMTGPDLEFELPTYICLAGADMSPTLNGKPLEHYSVIKVSGGDVLSYGKLKHGFRSYLAIKKGFQTKRVLDSRSQYFPVTPKSSVQNRDEISYLETSDFKPTISEIKTEVSSNLNTLEVYKGPEFSILSIDQLAILFKKGFTISKENNRMAYQLKELIEKHDYSMLTSGTLPGTVQLTPAGRLIILMKDGQTTGGYPRVLQLSEASISILAQKKYGDTISFKLL
ncbi:biotin-dependent carboxyltransferase family protein [Flagellimonas sp. HMM57]|uniref:5-oxoprolinase subunit C family protein n=1 Tax=unclassified Flagellimonas TaxID=2644544 RepID=UPI0013CF4B56|nr:MULTISPECIES: biotin-dependent carboxyltransferase family protein [unclassified Flagellimonas]UII75686.1 biotin-dependent carboxyltransferase family protein [Flagellimonas sp. HMM57]